MCRSHFAFQDLYPDLGTWLPFVACMTNTSYDIPDNGLDCANQFGLDWNAINACTTGQQGIELFQASIAKVRPGTNDTISCTINLNQEFWCQHNGDWVGCTEGNTADDFVKAVCSRYTGPQTPPVCQQYIETSAVASKPSEKSQPIIAGRIALE